jgi:hypothetical protein
MCSFFFRMRTEAPHLLAQPTGLGLMKTHVMSRWQQPYRSFFCTEKFPTAILELENAGNQIVTASR